MAASLREQILAQWLTELQGISIANGYNNDFDSIERWKLPQNEMAGDKLLLLKGGSEDPEDGTLQLLTRRLQIHIVLQVRHNAEIDGGVTETFLNSLEQDVYKAAMTDPQHGGLTKDTQWVGTSEAEEDEGGYQAEKTITFEVVYEHNYADESLDA